LAYNSLQGFVSVIDMHCRYQVAEKISALFDRKEWPKEQVQEDSQGYIHWQFLALWRELMKS